MVRKPERDNPREPEAAWMDVELQGRDYLHADNRTEASEMDDATQQPNTQTRDWFDADAMRLMQACDEIEQLRNSIATLLAEIEDILTREAPRIEGEWQIVVGTWENKLLEAQIDMRRAKRRYSLLQAKANSGAPIDLYEVEQQLDTELEDWRQQLDVAVERYEEAVSVQQRALQISMSEAIEEKRLYRILAKRLHPDLHPDLDEATKAMFSLAQLAYRQSDLKMLKSLEVSTAHLDAENQPPKTLEEAQAQIAELKENVDALEHRIDEIKQNPPYNLREKLDDTEWVNNHIGELKREEQNCREIESEYLRRCDEIASTRE